MNIGVIGVGRLGLCFALLLDRAGHTVKASDIRSNYVQQLKMHNIMTHEPQVADLLQCCEIEFTTDTRHVIKTSDVIYVMVATPSNSDGSYDVTAVQRVVADLEECDFDLTDKVLVIGCTTNPGDCQRIQDRLRPLGVQVLYNPEFIAQGNIIQDLEQADMVLIGGEDADVIRRYQALYLDIQTRTPNIHAMSLTAAEVTKIAVNCFLTTKISYANMIGQVLTRAGQAQHVDAALSAIGADTRIGSRYLRYGFGYGGPCLPRDNRAFAHFAQQQGVDFPLGQVVDQFNRDHAAFLTAELISANRDNRPFYIRDVAYKSGTDITEESQQLAVCELLLLQGHTVIIEPSDRLPPDLVQQLRLRFGHRVQFRTRQELIDSSEQFLEIAT